MKDNGVSKRMLLIGSLKNIRLSLNVKKIVSTKISWDAFKGIIEDAKVENPIISSMIDKVFEEYFKPLKAEQHRDNSAISLSDMKNMVDANQNQGMSFVKRDNHFKKSSENGEDAA